MFAFLGILNLSCVKEYSPVSCDVSDVRIQVKELVENGPFLLKIVQAFHFTMAMGFCFLKNSI
jgi:hypothetical protein